VGVRIEIAGVETPDIWQQRFRQLPPFDLVVGERTLQGFVQFAQCRIAVDPGEPPAFINDLARHDDEVDSLTLRPL
jgi:hypothetical protein